MRKRRLVLWVIAAQVLVCLVIWRNIQDSKMTGRSALAFCIAAFVSGLVLTAVSPTPKLVIFVAVIGSALAANIVNIAYDLFRDPTSHNLFPFELIMTSAISFVGTGIAIGARAIWRQ
jgi:hypothetical protein